MYTSDNIGTYTHRRINHIHRLGSCALTIHTIPLKYLSKSISHHLATSDLFDFAQLGSQEGVGSPRPIVVVSTRTTALVDRFLISSNSNSNILSGRF